MTEKKEVRIVEGWTRDLGIPPAWLAGGEVYNASRSFPCHEDKTGEFCHGIFYGVIWPDKEFADSLRERAIALDAHRIVEVSRKEVETWGREYCANRGFDYDEHEYDTIVRSYLNHKK